MGKDGAGLLGSEWPGGTTDPGLLSPLLCWPSCPSAGTDWGGGGSGPCRGRCKLVRAPLLVRTRFPPSSMLQVGGQRPTFFLGLFVLKPGDGENGGSRRGRARTQKPRSLPSAGASCPPGLPLLASSPRKPRSGGGAALSLSQPPSLAVSGAGGPQGF